MSGYEIGIIVIGALVGWWVVSWSIDKVRDLNGRPSAVELPPLVSAGPGPQRASRSMSKGEARALLGVDEETLDEGLFDAYVRKARECDLIMASTAATEEEKKSAQERRDQLGEAARVLQEATDSAT